MYLLKLLALSFIFSSSVWSLESSLVAELKATKEKKAFNEILKKTIDDLQVSISKRKENIRKNKSADRTVFEVQIETQVALERLLELSKKNVACNEMKSLMIFHYSPKNIQIKENKLPKQVQEVLGLLPIYCKL